MMVRVRAIDLRMSWLLTESISLRSLRIRICPATLCQYPQNCPLVCECCSAVQSFPPLPESRFHDNQELQFSNIHLCELRRVTTSDLLCAKRDELLLQAIELSLEVFLALSPKLGCLNLS